MTYDKKQLRERQSAIDTLSVWAVRYALGQFRSSYAVSKVVNCLLQHRDCLLPTSVEVIRRDVRDALNGELDGTDVDGNEAEWLRLYDALDSGGNS